MKVQHYRGMTALDFVKQEINRSCEHPFAKKVYDHEQKRYVVKLFPCKKCMSCLAAEQAKWVKRFQYESMSTVNKHVYFGTLTYSSDFLAHNKKYREDTAAFKKRKKGEWVPLLLCRKHMSLFWQRLRNNTGKQFTYFYCGEYGEHTSRPHFHFILWSNDSFTTDDINKAWSVYGRSISDSSVDAINANLLVDLVANGSLSDIRSDSPVILGQESKNVSKYVCKYINKMYMQSFFDKMHTKNEIIKYYKKNGIKTKHYQTPLNRDATHKQVISNRQKVKKIFKENNLQKTIEINEHTELINYRTPQEFFQQYLPYTMCCKDSIIGSRYVEEYAKDKSDLLKRQYDKFTGAPIVYPSSYKRSLVRKDYPILPCDDFSFNVSYENILCMPYVFDLIRKGYDSASDERNVFDYRTDWFFRDNRNFYQLKHTGEVRIFNWRTAKLTGIMSLDDFEKKCNYQDYLDFKTTWDTEFNELLRTKTEQLNEAIQCINLTEDFDIFRKRVKREYRDKFYRHQQEYNFKHKQF